MAIANAVPRRAAEFSAGRALARKAIHLAGGEIAAIPMRADRSPVWPRGFVGSISHSGELCAVAVAPSEFVCSLGLDIEQNDLATAEMVRYICTPDELLRARSLLADSDLAPRLLFSAKEAFFKASYPLFAVFLDFRDMEVSLTPGGGFTVASPLIDQQHYHFTGRWNYTGGVMSAGVTCLRG